MGASRGTGEDGLPPALLPGPTVRLREFGAETLTNRRFASAALDGWDRIFLPAPAAALLDEPPLGERTFLEDDNRSAIDPTPAATIDGQPFFLSVKGVGSPLDPFGHGPLTAATAAELSDDAETRRRLGGAGDGAVITGELWLRGSPYGGQGLPHAMTALRASERAEVTDLGGLRIAPIVKVAFLPEVLAQRLRSVYWYRWYRDRFVQELRLVPSNVRFYFHGRKTVGSDIGLLFDRFGLTTGARAHRFQVNLVRTGVALLTLFVRTMEYDAVRRRYRGLDFSDVWLDKDAVIAPDDQAYFIDLEGLEPIRVDADDLAEKLDDQIFRSLYEFMFAYEQVDTERSRRFRTPGGRRHRFEAILEEALAEDRFVRLRRDSAGLRLGLRPRPGVEPLKYEFPLVDQYRAEL